MIARIALCGLLAALLCAAAADQQDRQPASGGARWEEYQVLVERNIFDRQRGRPVRSVGETIVPPPPPPERFLLLMGVVRQAEQWTAFLEDARNGTINKVSVGDSVLQGRVTAIAIDSIEYEKDGVVARVKMGQNLEGGLRAPSGSPTTAAGGPTAAAPAASAGVTPGSADVLERLRLRRQREMGQ